MPASDQGVKPGTRYQLVPRVLVFVTCKDQVLLIQGAPHKRLWAGLYNGIGGHVEKGESLLEAAARELEEEAGISGLDLALSGIVTVDTGENPGVVFFAFRSDLQEEVELPWQQSHEGRLEWVPVDKLGELPTVEDLPVLLPKILGRGRGEAPFFAAYTYDRQGHLSIRFT